MNQESLADILKELLVLKTLVEQLRDNSRFDNWVFFPGNSTEYSYNKEGILQEEVLLRHNKVVLRKVYTYDKEGNLVRISVG